MPVWVQCLGLCFWNSSLGNAPGKAEGDVPHIWCPAPTRGARNSRLLAWARPSYDRCGLWERKTSWWCTSPTLPLTPSVSIYHSFKNTLKECMQGGRHELEVPSSGRCHACVGTTDSIVKTQSVWPLRYLTLRPFTRSSWLFCWVLFVVLVLFTQERMFVYS